jgi:hypothetical protein
MAVILSADNRALVRSARSSYLTRTHYGSNSTLYVANGTVFATDDLALIGEVGFEQAEIVRITSPAADSVAVSPSSSFAHSESARLTIVPYDQVEFYWTAANVFSTGTLLSTSSVTPDEWFTSYTDQAHLTGYGWYRWKNSVTGDYSGPSNAIPYTNYARNTVKNAIDAFYALLGQNDRKLVTIDMAMEWLNEANDEARDTLGMSQSEYGATDGSDSIAITAGVTEYALPDDFGELIPGTVIYDSELTDPIDYADKQSYLDSGYSDTRYYIRGSYIGFLPVPVADKTVTYAYQVNPAGLTSFSEVIGLPKTGFNCLKDFMLYRAGERLNRSDYKQHYETFKERMGAMVARGVNRDGSEDSWTIQKRFIS